MDMERYIMYREEGDGKGVLYYGICGSGKQREYNYCWINKRLNE